ncbi:uncharacterized protein DNG_02067 [Cephalotrichum gorgonifer]|uniref:Autophagy-related protein 13 n=1 Tax=Cephalotrichum gorgonifer TaxID=2041049 RepID=A0AAE8SS81_9PEZI|nr:uncharacterized protein DNG_02067 [Cephalotrichum gorgonifer]
MHQHPRAPPRASSPAAAQSNPARTNNPREGGNAAYPVGPGSGPASHSRRSSLAQSPAADPGSSKPPYESVKKLDQILQNFYLKAAALIFESRIPLHYTGQPGSSKSSKWFQIETRDFDDFRDELRTWKTCGSFDNRPPPMIIEVYLDTSELATNQSLVIIDDQGKRWDVAEALAASDSSGSDNTTGATRRGTDVILERWRIDLKTTAYDTDDFGPILPTIYKKAIVFFRALYLESRLSPCYGFAQHSKQKDMHPALRPRCRIKTSEAGPKGADGLRHPLYNTNRPVFEEYVLGDLEIPVGRLFASIAFRTHLDFRIDDAEKLLSSRFMGADEALFKPSLPQSLGRRPDGSGELRSQRQDRRPPPPTQTYGSLSTFHGLDALGTSPMSALNAVRAPGSDTSSPPSSAPFHAEHEPAHSVPISSGIGVPARPAARATGDHAPRRPSISFQAGKHPFKAGSLSGSPVPRSHEGEPPPSPQSVSRVAGLSALTQPRNRSSLTAGMPASLRGPAPPPAHAPTPGSLQEPMVSSPRPGSTSRYSSSFTHRRGRSSFSSGIAKPLDDDQLSSGRQSVSSSVIQPGSGLLAEGGGASSSSLQTDDDNISDFLKVLENKKNLKSFESSKRAESATNRTVAQLSKFHLMRDANNQLTESMTSSSAQLQRSSSSSSRQLTSVPGMVAPASLSVSSSPGKPLSPHTPHTPAIPSRLSENSVASYGPEGREGGGRRRSTLSRIPSGPSRESTVTQDRVAAIDIPLSPRVTSHGRRSSSVAQQPRTVSTDDDDGDLPFAHRSISLGADREPPTRSMMVALRGGDEDAVAEDGASPSPGLGPAASIRAEVASVTTGQGSGDGRSSGSMVSPSPSSPFGRRRYTGMSHAAGRGQTPPPSRGSHAAGGATGAGAGAGVNRQSRVEIDDDEPLLFVMSEMDAHSRRSLEDGRGHGSTGPGERDRGARKWKPGAHFAYYHTDTLASTENPFDKNKKRRGTREMVTQHTSPKVPLRPASGNGGQAAAGGSGLAATKAADLPFDADWLEDGYSPSRASQSQSQAGSQSQGQGQSQSQNEGSRDQPIDLMDRFNALSIGSQRPAPATDDSVVEIPPPAPQNAFRPDRLFGSRDKKSRPMSSAQQKAYNSVFVKPRTRPEHHRNITPTNNAYRVQGPRNPVFTDVKREVKTYSSLDVFGSTTSGGYVTTGGGAADDFYTDPKKAASDLKALLEGGMDEEEDDKAEGEGKNDGTIEGLKVKLLPHQVEGVEWMKGRELGPVKRGKLPRGGILADDMGLGKTLQSISLILTNRRPDKGDKAWKKTYEGVEKTTLVVAPLALIRQWEAEIKDKVTGSHSLRVYVHHGPQRTKSPKELASYDIVVTTYQTLVSEHGNSSDAADGVKAGCFGVHWWRVILDEAHSVKNRNAKATKACCALGSVFRWCLTGTPMQNNLDELQSLIHFLRIQPYDNLADWRAHIDKPMKSGKGHLAIRRLHSLLRCFMKRRTKEILKVDGALNPGGKPTAEGQKSSTGFKVTERKVVAVSTEFSEEEKRFYDRLQQRADKSLEKMLKGRVNYANALVLLLRLRQVCNHPKLVEGKLERDPDALGTVSGSGSGGKPISDTALDDLADMLAGASIRVRNCSICGYELVGEEARTGRETCNDCHADLEYFNNHGGRDGKSGEKRMKKGKKEKREKKEKEPAEVQPETPEKVEPETPEKVAKPIRGRGRKVIVDSEDEEEDGSWLVPEDQRGDLKLGTAGGSEDENCEGGGDDIGSEDSLHLSEVDDGSALDSFIVQDEEGGESQLMDPSEVVDDDNEFPSIQALCSQPTLADVSSTTMQETGSEASDSGSDSDSDAASEASDLTLSADDTDADISSGSQVVASAKIRELVKILQREAREHKFIVFSQFTSMLDLVEPFLVDEGFKHARYDGSMKNDEREESLRMLREDKATRILLCSLKCGSLGLNLTAATRVVILEPFWNPFIEEQAIDRVHRLTQKIDVVVYKLTVANTVEERILQLQEKKRLLAEQAIEGGMKKGAFKLGIAEMLALFKHGDSTDFGAEYEAREVAGAGVGQTRILESAGRPAVRRQESEIYGRRW